MDFALYRHRKLTDVFPVPRGLPELMADLTKQIIKFQPQNMEKFLADYLDSLIYTRELIFVAESTVCDILTKSLKIDEIIRKIDLPFDEANCVYLVIEDEFRKYLSENQNVESIKEFEIIKRLICECNLSIEKAKKIAKIIEGSWNFFYNQNKLLKSKCCSEKNETSWNPNIQGDKKRENDAAIKIQSWFRKAKSEEREKNDELILKSALTIQSSIRDFIQRKKINK